MVFRSGCPSGTLLSGLSLLGVNFTGVMVAFSLDFKPPPGIHFAGWVVSIISELHILSLSLWIAAWYQDAGYTHQKFICVTNWHCLWDIVRTLHNTLQGTTTWQNAQTYVCNITE